MLKFKSTKRAMLLSILSLLLCVSMLVGSTFAWFTDSVTSGRNKIQSGNLDVELYYAKTAEDAANNNWLKVDDQTDIFGHTLWEPGYTKIAYFKVVNNGTLASKYQLTADVYKETPGINRAGEEFLLSDHLFVDVVSEDATREQILALTSGKRLKTAVQMGEGTLEAEKESAVIAFAIWMPNSVGNVANHNGIDVPSIEFGINLIAAQAQSEKDSFNNAYDKDAGYNYGKTNVGPYKLDVLANGVATYDDATKTYSIDVNTVGQGSFNAAQGNTYFAGYTVNVAGYGENATVSFDKADGTGVTVWKLADEETDGFITNGEHQQWTRVGRKTAYRYDIDGDGVTDFTVVNDASAAKVEAATADELTKVLELGKSAILTADFDAAVVVPKDVTVTLDLNGHTLGNLPGDPYDKDAITNYGDLTITDTLGNGKVSIGEYAVAGGMAVVNYGTFTMESGTLEKTVNKSTNDNYLVSNYGTMVVNGGTIKSASENSAMINCGKDSTSMDSAAVSGSSSLTVNGGIFRSGNIAITTKSANDAVTIHDGSFNGYNTIWTDAAVINGGTFVYTDIGGIQEITGGTFSKDPSAFVHSGYVVVENANGTWTVVKGTAVSDAAALKTALAAETDGTTIVLRSGTYEGLSFVDPSSYKAKNVTVLGAKGAEINGFSISGWTADANIEIDGLTFKNVTFKNDLLLSTKVMKNVTVENCDFVSDARIHQNDNTEKLTDLVVQNCTFTGDKNGNKTALMLENTENVTVSGCTFTKIDFNVLQGGTLSGTVLFDGNIVNGTGDRVFRFVNVSNADITISNNTIISDGDSNGELAKATDPTDIALINNIWNGKTDAEVADKLINIH